MKRIKLAIIIAVVSLIAVAGISYAQIAFNANLTTSITYQNVGSDSATINFAFHPENDGTPINVSRTLAAGAGSSVFVGSLSEVGPGFSGSAVLSSDQPIVATLVQISGDSAVKNRPLSNGFSSGSSEVLFATVLKNQFSTTSRFSVQNVSSAPVNLTVNIYNASAPSDPPIVVTHNNLPAGAAKYFDMSSLPQVTASSFNGSATVTAVLSSDGTTPADIVGSVIEASTTGTNISAFEGVSGGSSTVYMASALCQAFGASSAYAVQNVGGSATTVTVTYASGQTDSATIQPGAKNSFQACAALPAGTSTAATITASGGGSIVSIGKVFGGKLSTAWVGASSGSEKVALPYVRYTVSGWANGSRQRGFIAIQNIGAPLNANDVTVTYRNSTGAIVGTHQLGALATGAKANTNARHPDVVGNAADLEEFGYVGGIFGGSVIIEGPPGSELVAVVRIQSSDGGSLTFGEDATGIPFN